MRNSGRFPIAIIAAIVLVACLCILGLGALGYWFYTAVPDSPEPTEMRFATPEALATLPISAETPIAAATATPTMAGPPVVTEEEGGDGLSAEVIANMQGIEQQVIAIRGLEPAGEFTRAIFSPEELRERVETDFFADYTPEEAADDALILSVFGLLEPDFDLIALYIELFSEQVAGFYDDETKEMVVVGEDRFGGPEKLTYAHEYNHALQDQNYDFDGGLNYNDDSCEIDTERCAAIQALIEGDATLLEVQWFIEYATDTDAQEIVDYYNSLDLTVIDDAPAFLQEDFIFPYDEGYLFVESLFNAGGWEAVDAAYASPPVSTEQILHPEKYPADAPVAVTLPDLLPTLGDGWELLDDNVMGEWYTYLILGYGLDPGARLTDETAQPAAAGWGGDRYHVYHHEAGGGLAMVLKAAWDTPADADEFSAAFAEYAGARFGPGSAGPAGTTLYESDAGVHLFVQIGGETVWIAAPDLAVAEAVLGAVE